MESASPSWKRRLFVPWLVFVVALAVVAVASRLRRGTQHGEEPAR